VPATTATDAATVPDASPGGSAASDARGVSGCRQRGATERLRPRRQPTTARAGQARADSAARAVQLTGGFLIGAPLQGNRARRPAVLLRQPGDLLIEHLAEIVSGEGVVAFTATSGSCATVEGSGPPCARRRGEGDAVQPGRRARRRGSRRQANEGEERGLKASSASCSWRRTPAHAEHHRSVPPQKYFERCLVARNPPLEQLAIRQSPGGSAVCRR
jgi:hypothetical protein